MIQVTITLSDDALEGDREVEEIFSQVVADVNRDYDQGELSIGTTFVGQWEMKHTDKA